MKRDDLIAWMGTYGFSPLVANTCIEVSGSVREVARLLIDAQGGDVLPSIEQDAVRAALGDTERKLVSRGPSSVEWDAPADLCRSIQLQLIYAEPQTRDDCMEWRFTFGFSRLRYIDKGNMNDWVPICYAWQTTLSADIFGLLMNTAERCTKERFGAVRQIDPVLAGSSAVYVAHIDSVVSAPRRKAGCWVTASEIVRISKNIDLKDCITSLEQLKELWCAA